LWYILLHSYRDNLSKEQKLTSSGTLHHCILMTYFTKILYRTVYLLIFNESSFVYNDSHFVLNHKPAKTLETAFCLRPGSNAVLHMSPTQFNQLGSCEVWRLTQLSSTDFISVERLRLSHVKSQPQMQYIDLVQPKSVAPGPGCSEPD